MAIVMTPRLEAVQLSFEEGQRRPATETAPVSRGRDNARSARQQGSSTGSRPADARLDSLVALARRARQEDDHLRRAKVLLRAERAVRAAFAETVADARAAGHSWRRLGAQLDVPFQTLHGRLRKRSRHRMRRVNDRTMARPVAGALPTPDRATVTGRA